MTQKERKRRIKILKSEYLEGNYVRLIRKHYKNYYYELIYSRTLPKWREESSESKKAVRYLLRICKWPKHVVEVANLLRTLEKHFGWSITKKNVLLAYTIWEYLGDDIEKRMTRKYAKSITDKIRDIKYYTPTKAQAIKEQLARGFVHVNDFEDYDSSKNHVYSNIKRDYLYPMNFGMTSDDSMEGLTNLYIGQYLTGVRGWTRAKVNDRVIHKN